MGKVLPTDLHEGDLVSYLDEDGDGDFTRREGEFLFSEPFGEKECISIRRADGRVLEFEVDASLPLDAVRAVAK
jgi:hypothetical protein